ncbi:hypothetical protein VNO80_21190 [Phaseolus coccineus]|uniref:Uncharacterized protein n=1 Tax=Phaseolus coccineus TaxID=3886 RepID=A0AAN9QSU4_PHACN
MAPKMPRGWAPLVYPSSVGTVLLSPKHAKEHKGRGKIKAWVALGGRERREVTLALSQQGTTNARKFGKICLWRFDRRR